MKNFCLITIVLVMVTCQLTGCNRTKQVPPRGLPYYNSPDFSPQWMEGELPDSFHSIAPFSFTDQEGHMVSNESLKGKPYVCCFFFTSCGSICPKMMASMYKVQQQTAGGKPLHLLSFSVTPWIDTEEKLKQYAEKHKADAERWHLLRGDKEVTYTLARRSFFAEGTGGYDKGSDEFLHTENFILVDGQGHIRGIYNGTMPLDMDRLIADLHTLQEKG